MTTKTPGQALFSKWVELGQPARLTQDDCDRLAGTVVIGAMAERDRLRHRLSALIEACHDNLDARKLEDLAMVTQDRALLPSDDHD